MGAPPRLLVITPADSDAIDLVRLLPPLHGFVDLVLLRWPGLSARRTLERARRLAGLSCRPALSVSDRFDVALAAGVEGVHLKDDGLSPAQVRRLAPRLLVGVSRHDRAGVQRSAGADYLTLGPYAETPSKPGRSPMPREEFRRLCALSAVGVLALGGVDAFNAGHALRDGAAGVACIRAIWDAVDPVAAARELRTQAQRS